MNYRNWFSKERITNNDDFCFKSPITRPDHFRLVLTPEVATRWNICIYASSFSCYHVYTARNAQVAAGLSSACRRMSSTGRISNAFARHVAACRHMAATVCCQICYKTVLTELQQCCWEQICYKLV